MYLVCVLEMVHLAGRGKREDGTEININFVLKPKPKYRLIVVVRTRQCFQENKLMCIDYHLPDIAFVLDD